MTIKEFILWKKVYAQWATEIKLSPDNNATYSAQNPSMPAPVNPNNINQNNILVDPNQVTPLTISPASSLNCSIYWKFYTNNKSPEKTKNGSCACSSGWETTKTWNLVACKDIWSALNSLCTNKDPKYSVFNTSATDTAKLCICKNGEAKNADGSFKNPRECIKTPETLGIKCTPEQLINNTCSRNIYQTLWIRQSNPTPSPTTDLQDVVFAATAFVGTIMMVGLIWLGLQAVLKGADDSNAMDDIKTKIKNLIIWLLLVIGSYTIIRLIQYIAKGV